MGWIPGYQTSIWDGYLDIKLVYWMDTWISNYYMGWIPGYKTSIWDGYLDIKLLYGMDTWISN